MRMKKLAVYGVLFLATMLTADDTAAAVEQELIARLDEVFATSMEDSGVPGGVVIIVEDGRIVHARGFGVADLETRRPVDPDQTLFYLASLTKTFTATAVMQLVESGKLRLEQDVNEYMSGVRVPTKFDEPITLHHLLTHTAGFDDRNIGYVTRSLEERVPLREYLATSLPSRVAPPGSIIGYSNHGYGLAGYLVESASGESFEEYLENHILAPLGMVSSTAHTPPPPAFESRMATGYSYDVRAGGIEPHPLGARNIPPAGTVIATATDVGRFMLAHLGDGGITGGGRILRPETSRLQKRRQFTHHPDLPGIAYGYYERLHNGHRALEHAGSYPGWSTVMTLLPEDGIGIFMATNQSTSDPHYATLDVLLNELWGEPESVEPIEPRGDPEQLDRFRGAYQSTRYSRSTVEKFAIFDTQIAVGVDADGYLTIKSRHGRLERWVAIEPLVFRRDDAPELLAFRENADGEITHLFRSSGRLQFPMAYERLHWHDRLSTQLTYLYVAASILLASISLWPLALLVRWIVQRLRGRSSAMATPAKVAIGMALLAGLLLIVFIAGLDGLLGNSRYRQQLVYGMTSEMTVLLWIPIFTTALSALIGWFAFQSWRRRWWTIWGRAWYTVVATTMISFVGFLLNWRLLGFWY